MFFDKACKMAERHLPKIKQLLQEARLFDLSEYSAHEMLPESLSPEELEYQKTGFSLPFPVCWFEDKATGVLLVDTHPEQLGMDVEHFYVEYFPMGGMHEGFDANHMPIGVDVQAQVESMRQMTQAHGVKFEDCCIMHFGTIQMKDLKNNGVEFGQYGSLHRTLVGTPEKVILDISGEEINEELLKSSIINAAVAFKEAMTLNSPNRFILETAPLKIKKQKKAGLIPRSHQRPKYTLLKPKEIRKQMGITDPETTGSRKPHERRAHPRRLTSEKFTKMQGKIITIPATWIGPSESIVGKRKYKVLLDK